MGQSMASDSAWSVSSDGLALAWLEGRTNVYYPAHRFAGPKVMRLGSQARRPASLPFGQ